MSTNISHYVVACLKRFKCLASISIDRPEYSSRTPEWKIIDESSRFKVWSGNIGAHQRGRSSLDYRLRDASHLASQVIDLLRDLEASLDNACSILDGTKIPWDQELPEDVSDDESTSGPEDGDIGFPTEMDQTAMDVTEVINCLMNLSVSIQNPAPHDRFRASIDTDTSFYEPSDIGHVREKWEKADRSLVTLLGKANTRRRQYFKYRKSHHQKLSRNLDIVFDTGKSISERQSTVASSIPDAQKIEPTSQADTVDSDELSESGYTQTSYASSNDTSARPRFPALPPSSADGTFECPFCFMMIRVTNSQVWRKHIFADLRPYSCVAVNCPIAGTEFGQRHQWMQHMLQNHWQEWRCEFCDHEPFISKWSFREHLENQHAEIIPTNEIETAISRYEKPQTSENDKKCPLCLLPLGSIKEYRRHVGRHLENIALFVLPKVEGDPEESDDESRISDRSDLKPDSVDSDQVDQSESEDLSASEESKTQHANTSSDESIRTDQVSEGDANVSQAEITRPGDAQKFASSSMGGSDSDDRDTITSRIKQERNNKDHSPGEIHIQPPVEGRVGAQIDASHAPSDETPLSDTPELPGSIGGERSLKDIEPSIREGSEHQRGLKYGVSIGMKSQNSARSNQETEEEQKKLPEVPSAATMAARHKSDTQRFSADALQEGLDSCRQAEGRDSSKENDLDAQRAYNIDLENRNLQEENTTLRRERDAFESEIHELRRRLAPSSESDYMIDGGSVESSDELSRVGSMLYKTKERKSRLLERINTVNPSELNRDSTRRRLSSISQQRTPFTRDILGDNRTLRGPPLTTRAFDRFENDYTTSPTIRPEAGSVLSPESGTSSINTFNTAISGDYVPEPIPPKPNVQKKSPSSRKHRHH